MIYIVFFYVAVALETQYMQYNVNIPVIYLKLINLQYTQYPSNRAQVNKFTLKILLTKSSSLFHGEYVNPFPPCGATKAALYSERNYVHQQTLTMSRALLRLKLQATKIKANSYGEAVMGGLKLTYVDVLAVYSMKIIPNC